MLDPVGLDGGGLAGHLVQLLDYVCGPLLFLGISRDNDRATGGVGHDGATGNERAKRFLDCFWGAELEGVDLRRGRVGDRKLFHQRGEGL